MHIVTVYCIIVHAVQEERERRDTPSQWCRTSVVRNWLSASIRSFKKPVWHLAPPFNLKVPSKNSGSPMVLRSSDLSYFHVGMQSFYTWVDICVLDSLKPRHRPRLAQKGDWATKALNSFDTWYVANVLCLAIAPFYLCRSLHASSPSWDESNKSNISPTSSQRMKQGARTMTIYAYTM